MESSANNLKQRRRHVRDAVILVAGRGSRLRPVTDTTPKCLLDVNGQPLVVRLLRQLKSAGVERAWLVIGYLGDTIRETLGGIDDLPELRWVHNDTWSTFNNAESVRSAMAAMETPRDFLLCDGDAYVQNDAFLRELVTDSRANVLGVELRLHQHLAGEDMKFQLEPVDVPWYSRRVMALGKGLNSRWSHGESIGFQVVSGKLFSPLLEAFDGLSDEEREALYYEDVFARLLGDDHEFYTHAVQPDSWTEIDTIDDLEAARQRFNGRSLAVNA